MRGTPGTFAPPRFTDRAGSPCTAHFVIYPLSSPQPRPGGEVTVTVEPITFGSVAAVLVNLDVFHYARHLSSKMTFVEVV